MSNLSRDFLIFGIPHIFSKVDQDRKKIYKNRYRYAKRFGIKTVFTVSGGLNGIELVRDIVVTKVKSRGYKLFWLLVIGPLLQALSVPLYVAKAQKTAIVMAQIGAEILKGEMTITDTMWMPIDLIFFGEIVPGMENTTTVSIWSNETVNLLNEVNEVMGDMLLKD